MQKMPEARSIVSSSYGGDGTMYTSCPFARWGVDLVGHFPLATGLRKLLIEVFGCFSKCVEVIPLANINEKNVIRFMWRNICCRFGVLTILVSDNDT